MEIQAKWLAPMYGIFSSCMRERNVKKIHEFYETLLFNVESLRIFQSLNKLDAAVEIYTRQGTSDKERLELAMSNDTELWRVDLGIQFLKALNKWTKKETNAVDGDCSS